LRSNERDQARQELGRAYSDAQPKAANPAIAGPCFVCRRWWGDAAVKAMIKASQPRFDLFLCDGCIGEMQQLAAEGIAARSNRAPQ
jgi:hypothetical protein